MAEIKSLPGVFNRNVPNNEVNQELVDSLKNLLLMAENGEIDNIVATAFTKPKDNRLSLICLGSESVYSTVGSLDWIKEEYKAMINSINEY